MRLDIIDGMRGHLLIGMMSVHLSFLGAGHLFGLIHHVTLIGMFDAEFFIVISGFLIGYLTTLRMNETHQFRRFLRKRMVTIYKYYLATCIPFALMFLIENGAASFGAEALPRILTVQDGGLFADILPIYLYCFIILFALTLYSHKRYGPLLFVSGLIHIASQFDFGTGFFGFGGDFLSFDIAAWQFLFILSYVAGLERQRIAALIARPNDIAIVAIVGVLTLGVIGFRFWYIYPYPVDVPPDMVMGILPRWQLHPIFVIKIGVFCLLVAILLTREHILFRPARAVMEWYFRLGFLRAIGSYSIQMFTLHVFLCEIFDAAKSSLDGTGRYALGLALLAIFIAAPNIWVAIKARRSEARA